MQFRVTFEHGLLMRSESLSFFLSSVISRFSVLKCFMLCFSDGDSTGSETTTSLRLPQTLRAENAFH